MADPLFADADAVNTRSVEWLSEAAPVGDFAPDIRAAFRLQGTLKRISAPKAVDRIVETLGSEAPPIHLIVKWSSAHGADTVEKHMAVASGQQGAVWWGLRGSPDKPKIGAETLEKLRAQIAAGQDTHVFLSGPSCWRTTLSGVAVNQAERRRGAHSVLLLPEDQEHGLWVRISDFEKTTREWLTSHLELAKAPGKLLAEKSLSQTTNPLIVVEAADSPSGTPRVWWVCQGASYNDSKKAGVMSGSKGR